MPQPMPVLAAPACCLCRPGEGGVQAVKGFWVGCTNPMHSLNPTFGLRTKPPAVARFSGFRVGPVQLPHANFRLLPYSP